MQKLVLLVVGAVWVAVLVPPLLRSRGESRPHSSVDLFRRNLSVLQKTTPSRIHVQALGRPLAAGRPTTEAATRATLKKSADPRLRRSSYELAERREPDHTGNLKRRSEAHPHNRRELMRKRREQMVRILLFFSVTTGLLALLAKSPMLIYACAACVMALIGYCAMLLRLRREAELYSMDEFARQAA